MDMASRYIVVLLVLGVFSYGKTCPSVLRSATNGIGTFQNGTVYEQVRYGHYIELDCCPRKKDSPLKWMKWSKETKQWCQYVPGRKEVRFLDNKQILAIQSSRFEDAGLYKCISYINSSVTDVTKFQLNVVACDKLARGPYPIAPLPCDDTITKEMNTVTLPCTGYFGCGEEGDIRIVTWYVSLDKYQKDNWRRATSVDKRYKQIDFQTDGSVVQGSNLTIEGVSALDFNRKFMCLLASPQVIKGQSKLIVTLKKDDTEKTSTFKLKSTFCLVQTLTFIYIYGLSGICRSLPTLLQFCL